VHTLVKTNRYMKMHVGQPCFKYCTFSRHTRKCNCMSARKEKCGCP